MFTHRELCRTWNMEKEKSFNNVISIHELLYFSLLNKSHKPVLSEAIWLFHIIIQLHVQLIVQRITTITAQDTLGTKIHNHQVCNVVTCNHGYKRMTMSWPDRATCEEYNPLQLLVVEEVVERPEATLFTKGVRVQIRVVATNQHRQDKILLAQLVTVTTGRVVKKNTQTHYL